MDSDQRNRILTKLLERGEELHLEPDGWHSYLSKFVVGGDGDEQLERVQSKVEDIIHGYRKTHRDLNNITKHDREMLTGVGMTWEVALV